MRNYNTRTGNSVGNQTQMHGKVNGLIFLHIMCVCVCVTWQFSHIVENDLIQLSDVLTPGEQIIKYYFKILSRNYW